jgi:uncharacterized protein
MIYIDTSVWVAALCKESTSPRITAWFYAQAPQNLIASVWVRTEIASALSIKARRGDIESHNLADRHEKLALMSALSPPWVAPEAVDFEHAYALCAAPTTKLRAGDALHLAIAKRLKCKQFFSLDDVLNANATALGFKAMAI